MTSGARVRNTYATFLQLENSPKKFGLTLHSKTERHRFVFKPPGVEDGHALH
jgi:hypothetical protein